MAIRQNHRTRVLRNQLSKLCFEEQELLTRKQGLHAIMQIDQRKNTLQAYIPDRMQEMFADAFAGAFGTVLHKGRAVIETTYNKDAKAARLSKAAWQLEYLPTRKSFEQLQKSSRAAIRINKLLSAAEGSMLGVLGVGLPDIPIFVGMLLRTIYEVALSYGFAYDTPEEQGYILSLLCLAFCENSRTEAYSRASDQLAAHLAREGRVSPQQLKQEVDQAASLLSAHMTLAKVVQGLPMIGVVGGLSNYQMISCLGKVANLKYQKRFLERELLQL